MGWLLRKTVWWFLKKFNQNHLWSSNPTSGYRPQRTENPCLNQHAYTRAWSSPAHGSQTQSLPTRECVNKMGCVRAEEEDSALERKEALTVATMWMELQKPHAQ